MSSSFVDEIAGVCLSLMAMRALIIGQAAVLFFFMVIVRTLIFLHVSSLSRIIRMFSRLLMPMPILQ